MPQLLRPNAEPPALTMIGTMLLQAASSGMQRGHRAGSESGNGKCGWLVTLNLLLLDCSSGQIKAGVCVFLSTRQFYWPICLHLEITELVVVPFLMNFFVGIDWSVLAFIDRSRC
jgi:hypothetical protein